ncbi:MAG TPA: AfsR/SARP family transcriptional regulator [Acidimicrobiales bacterium]|nr:AfsR/SARP family transcriptional regulator [Acidimicrobiales bacterium]
MELRVLGPMEVADDESRLIDLGVGRHRAVLAALVMEAGRVVSLDRLVDSLWGDDPPPTANKTLQVYVSRLRKALEADRRPGAPFQVLVTQPPGYVLRADGIAVDAVRFGTLAAEGERLLRAGKAAEAREALDSGLRLWRGSAYEGLAFESFVQQEIARLDELRAVAAENRVEAMLALGRNPDAVIDVERLVADDPLRERRWALLALALYRTGRQGEALRTLDRARRTLGEELGIEPGPELRRLERDILAQAPALELRLPDEDAPRAARRVPLGRATAAIASLASALAPARQERTREPAVLPPTARPHGFSLEEMAIAVTPFTMSGSDPAYYPDTPFQILYIDSVDVRPVGSGFMTTGSNSFTAGPETCYFVPIFYVDDLPPVLGTFPTTPAGAAAYFFDPAHYGARDFEAVVDGTSTAVGAEYLAGPFLSTEDASHKITLAVFVGPLPPGAHTVVIRGGIFGRGMAETFGSSFLQLEFAYAVDVVDVGQEPGSAAGTDAGVTA